MNNTRIAVTVTGADIENVTDEITRPDYPITFNDDRWGDISADTIAQERGKKMWAAMHGETPNYVYYNFSLIENNLVVATSYSRCYKGSIEKE
jgi:hypothetical protein